MGIEITLKRTTLNIRIHTGSGANLIEASIFSVEDYEEFHASWLCHFCDRPSS